MERAWSRAQAAAQDGLDAAEQEAADEAGYLADMLARGVETTSAFATSEERFDELQRDVTRWRAVRDAAASRRLSAANGRRPGVPLGGAGASLGRSTPPSML